MKGNKVRPGTAIASFRGRRYGQDHAAILVKQTKRALIVWDQFNNTRSGKPKPWGKRRLKFAKGKDRSNNGNMFYVIAH